MQISVQSPGHITGFFVIFTNGSTGAGLNVAEGMKTTVQQAQKDSFTMNGRKEKLIVSEAVLRLFRKKTGTRGKVKVEHLTKFPIGYGLGISGAGALSLSLALNKLFRARLSKKEALEIAKRAEIECGTGLGDVVAEQFAGLMVGKKPYPSKAAEQIKCSEKSVALGFLKPIVTKKIIRSAKWKRKINKIGKYCMKEFSKEKGMASFIKFSRVFTKYTGLGTPKITAALSKIHDGSMAMLGETIFVPTNSPQKAEKMLKKFCKKTMVCKIASKGAEVL